RSSAATSVLGNDDEAEVPRRRFPARTVWVKPIDPGESAAVKYSGGHLRELIPEAPVMGFERHGVAEAVLRRLDLAEATLCHRELSQRLRRPRDEAQRRSGLALSLLPVCCVRGVAAPCQRDVAEQR